MTSLFAFKVEFSPLTRSVSLPPQNSLSKTPVLFLVLHSAVRMALLRFESNRGLLRRSFINPFYDSLGHTHTLFLHRAPACTNTFLQTQISRLKISRTHTQRNTRARTHSQPASHVLLTFAFLIIATPLRKSMFVQQNYFVVTFTIIHTRARARI